MLNIHYTEDFYNRHVTGMSKSAEIILPLIYRLFSPNSVLDIGCGQGAWLAAAEALGTHELKGIDGPWVNEKNLRTSNIDFESVDLGHSMPVLRRRYDLCISLEVAEHLPSAKACEFVDLLCASSDLILFGAAIQHQGGENHINEQWQSYWINLFSQKNYSCMDLIRPEIWSNDDVEWWYKQNTFIFTRRDSVIHEIFTKNSPIKTIHDLVHPENYRQKIIAHENSINNPSIKFCGSIVKKTALGLPRKLKSSINKLFRTDQ